MTSTSTTLVNAGASKELSSNPTAPYDELQMDVATAKSDAEHVNVPESGETGQEKSGGEEEEGGVMEEEQGEEGEGEPEGEEEAEEGEDEDEMEEDGNGADQPTVFERYGFV